MSGETCPTCGAAVSTSGVPHEWHKGYWVPSADVDRQRVWVVLADLVRLKAIKDKHGKTPEYEAAQAMAWQAAREALNGEP